MPPKAASPRPKVWLVPIGPLSIASAFLPAEQRGVEGEGLLPVRRQQLVPADLARHAGPPPVRSWRRRRRRPRRPPPADRRAPRGGRSPECPTAPHARGRRGPAPWPRRHRPRRPPHGRSSRAARPGPGRPRAIPSSRPSAGRPARGGYRARRGGAAPRPPSRSRPGRRPRRRAVGGHQLMPDEMAIVFGQGRSSFGWVGQGLASRHSTSSPSSRAPNSRMLATRSPCPVSMVRVRSTGPETAMQAWPAASP